MKGFVNLTHTNNKKIEILREELNKKQSGAPVNNVPLINDSTGKLDNAYLPSIISGTSRKFAGTFGEDGIIVASAYASELQGLNINDIVLTDCVGYEFAYIGENPFNLSDLEVNKNDIVVCNGDQKPNWTLYDNSDKVVSVNGQTGAVQIDVSIDESTITKNNQYKIQAVALKDKNNNLITAQDLIQALTIEEV